MPRYTPVVIEKDEHGNERSYDLFSRLLKDRIIMLDTDVNSDSASIITASLLFLQSEDKKAPIHFYINSPGGSVIAGMQIYDTMKMISCPVHTYVLGQAASMGSFLASSGDKRYMSQYSRHMMHMVSSGNQGQILDMEVEMEETRVLNEMLMGIYSENTGQSAKKIKKDIQRNLYLSAEKSIAYGLADAVIPLKKFKEPQANTLSAEILEPKNEPV